MPVELQAALVSLVGVVLAALIGVVGHWSRRAAQETRRNGGDSMRDLLERVESHTVSHTRRIDRLEKHVYDENDPRQGLDT